MSPSDRRNMGSSPTCHHGVETPRKTMASPDLPNVAKSEEKEEEKPNPFASLRWGHGVTSPPAGCQSATPFPPGVNPSPAGQNPTNPFSLGNVIPQPASILLMKPKDIPILKLDDLQGLDAAARLQIFFKQVEQCSPYDGERIRAAKGRVGPHLAVLIHSRQTTLQTWVEFKEFFHIEFAVEVNVDRAWQELENSRYEWTETPQLFTNRFIYRHAMLITCFTNTIFTFKRKLWQGLPKMSKERLKDFLEDDYPLQKFTDHLELERLYLEASNGSNVWQIPEQKEATETIPPPPTTVSTVSKEEIEGLRKQVRELKASPVHTSFSCDNITGKTVLPILQEEQS